MIFNYPADYGPKTILIINREFHAHAGNYSAKGNTLHHIMIYYITNKLIKQREKRS